MAKYLKPLRGKFSSATQQDILLRKGEMFLCLLNDDNMGQGPGAVYIGDGISAFNGYNHNGSTVPNTAQPFLIHPAKYNPIFANTNPSTASWTIDAATSEINNIGKGKAEVDLPTIVGNIKGALCKHANSITRLANDDDAIRGTLDEHARELASHSDSIVSIDQRVSKLESQFGELYPVGSVYITVIDKDPNEILGYGVWSKLPQNYVLKTIESGNGGSTISAQNTGGHSLTIPQLPSHAHTINSLTGSVTIGKHSHNMSSYTITGTGTATADNSSTHSHHINAFSVNTESGGTQPKYAYPAEVPVEAGGDHPISGCEHSSWKWESCRVGDDSPTPGTYDGGDPAGGPHIHKVTITAHDTTNGGKHSHPVSVSGTVGQKTTIEANLGSKSVTFGNKTTDKTGSGEAHSHTPGMPASIGVFVWRRTS